MMQTELPTSTLADWVVKWAKTNEICCEFKVKLRPHSPGSPILELSVLKDGEEVANVIFSSLKDRNKQSILSIRDQNTAEKYRQKRLMTLLHIFLLNRFKSDVVHYLTPTEDNAKQCEGMKRRGIYTQFNEEIGQLIVAEVGCNEVAGYISDPSRIDQLLEHSLVLV